jgi:hypothetical protein
MLISFKLQKWALLLYPDICCCVWSRVSIHKLPKKILQNGRLHQEKSSRIVSRIIKFSEVFRKSMRPAILEPVINRIFKRKNEGAGSISRKFAKMVSFVVVLQLKDDGDEFYCTEYFGFVHKNPACSLTVKLQASSKVCRALLFYHFQNLSCDHESGCHTRSELLVHLRE